ncbi:MAG: hypothetical protein ACRDNS_12920 [Trebonia sp.]
MDGETMTGKTDKAPPSLSPLCQVCRFLTCGFAKRKIDMSVFLATVFAGQSIFCERRATICPPVPLPLIGEGQDGSGHATPKFTYAGHYDGRDFVALGEFAVSDIWHDAGCPAAAGVVEWRPADGQ